MFPVTNKYDPYEQKPVKRTLFRRYLQSGDIPIHSVSNIFGKTEKSKKNVPSIKWKMAINEIDYCYIFPLMIEGLADSDVSVRNIAYHAAIEMIFARPDQILKTIPLIILPIKKGMNTRNPEIIKSILKVIQVMAKNGPCVGQALIPYFRQILPVCNLFKHINVNLFDEIDWERRIGDVVEDTLQILEQCGGRDAYLNIRYIIPTYESYVMNVCHDIIKKSGRCSN